MKCQFTKNYRIHISMFILLWLLMPYGLFAQNCNKNFIIKGGFESGNSGFSSGLIYTANNLSGGAGTYTITSNANLAAGGLANFFAHSGSLFMIVDGATTNNTLVWSQAISCLIPGQQYTFSFWAADVHFGYPVNQSPSLNVQINGQGLTNPVILTGLLNNVWTLYTYQFNASTSNATIEIRQSTGYVNNAGNDFGIDDISLTGPYNLQVSTGVEQCFSNCNGVAQALTSCAASYTLTYSWNTVPVQTTQTAMSLCTGTYLVTVTDTLGCSGVGTAVINCPCTGCHNVHNDCAINAPVPDQDCFWSTGGNSVATADGAINFIGTTSNNNTPFRIYTHGIERMRINADPGTTNGFIGIGTTSPQKNLEINTSVATPASGQTGFSGLRFTDLNSSHLSSTGNGKVLSVNSTGDVVLVSDATGNSSLSVCAPFNNGIGNPSNYISKFSGTSQFCNSAIWENSSADHRVGIGTTSPSGQLDIVSSINNNGVNVGLTNSGVSESVGLKLNVNSSTNHPSAPWLGGTMGVSGYIFNDSPNQASMADNFTVVSPIAGRGFGGRYKITCDRDPADVNYGVFSQVEAAKENVGYLANVYTNFANAIENYGFVGGVGNAANQNTGLKCDAYGGNYSYGVYAKARNSKVENFGVFGQVDATVEPCAFNVGVYGSRVPGDYMNCGTTNTWAGYFDGDVNINGDIYLWNAYFASDRKLKNNLQRLNSPIDNLLKINCYSYSFKTEEYKRLNLPQGEQYGVIAQELKEIFPNLVKEKNIPAEYDKKTGEKIKDSYPILAVEYHELIPWIIAGIQEQQSQITESTTKITSLEEKIKSLENALASCCTNYEQLKSDLSNNETNLPSLQQNNPNPFTETTTINYYVPSSSKTSSIKVYTLNGVELKSLPINQTGKGFVVFRGGELSAGTYVYNLIVDGKQVDSKWMMLTK